MSYLDEHSVTWRYSGDARLVPFLGAAFLLQAAHPTIAAGVADHSTFKADPFGRLQHSFGLVLQATYAADGDRVAAAIRESHKQIKGVTPDGRHYHAYEPEAYYWVLASGGQIIHEAARRFGRPMTELDERRSFEEGREMGRRFGLRDRDMPATPAEFEEWYAWMLDERLENSKTVQDVIATIRRPSPPQGVPGIVWPLPRELTGRLSWLATIGMIPPALRERFDVRWSRLDELQLGLVGRASQALALLPPEPFYLPVAREAFARRAAAHRDQRLAA